MELHAVHLWDLSVTAFLFCRELWLQNAGLLPSWEPLALQFLTLQLSMPGTGPGDELKGG